MKKSFLVIVVTLGMALIFTACGGSSATETSNNIADTQTENQTDIQEENEMEEGAVETNSEKRVAKDDAVMQTENPSMPTRVIENGTKVNIHFGDTVIPGILNDSDTAKALIRMLPYTVHMSSYSHDLCGVMLDDLLYNEDEENLEQYGYQVNIGVMDCELSRLMDLSGSYNVLIELAE